MKKSFIGATLMLFSLWGLTTQTQLLIAATPSLPNKVFLMVKGMPAQRGDLVAFQGHATAYASRETLYIKRVMGVTGDKITLTDDTLFLKGQPLGKIRHQTQEGRPLTPLASQVIPEGKIFVMASHPSSFDSRVQEFGLVSTQHLLGKTWGIL